MKHIGFFCFFNTVLILHVIVYKAEGQKSVSSVKGKVWAITEKGGRAPLPYASVYWAETTTGATTDESGDFSIHFNPGTNILVASFVGYRSDTVEVKSSNEVIELTLVPYTEILSGVEVKDRAYNSFVTKLTTIKTEHITTEGLKQLACCNLSESFENSLTVDVGYTDAVTGAKQIQMLGLAGVYSQLMLENMPFLRSIAAPYGLNYVEK